MIESVYIGTLAPFLFLLFVLKEDNRRLILFFLAGLTAALAAWWLNGLAASAFMDASAVSIRLAPALEELLKILPLAYYLFSRKKERGYETVRNALAVGIGFSILENIAYLTVLAPEGLRGSVGFSALRSASACLLHGSLAALSGWAVRQVRLYRVMSPALLFGVFALAVMIHALFNLLAAAPSLWPLCVLVPGALFASEILAWNFFGKKSAALPAAIAERTSA